MSEVNFSFFVSESFGESSSSGKLAGSKRHAQDLVGTPDMPSLFSRLAEQVLLLEPSQHDHYDAAPVPLPHLTQAIVFTTARQAIPYSEAFLGFWKIFRPEMPASQLPRLDVVDPSIPKGGSKTYETAVEAQQERLGQLAEASGRETIAYVFDECVIRGGSLGSGVRILKAAGFKTVARLALAPF